MSDDIQELRREVKGFYCEFDEGTLKVFDEKDRLIDLFYQDDFEAVALERVEERHNRRFPEVKK